MKRVVTVVVPEETISKGIEPGTEKENMKDGWGVTYERFLVTVGNFRARRSDTNASIGDPSVYVLDLKNAPASGYVVADLKGVAAARWDKFAYDIPNAKAGAKILPPTKQSDADLMELGPHLEAVYGRSEALDSMIRRMRRGELVPHSDLLEPIHEARSQIRAGF